MLVAASPALQRFRNCCVHGSKTQDPLRVQIARGVHAVLVVSLVSWSW